MAGQIAHDVVFLFSDIESSTRLWEQYPVEMRAWLERHDAIVEDAVGSSGGQIVKTTGDGVMAAFTPGNAAVQASLAIQRGLHAEEWGPTESLRVRIGLHVGEAQSRGADYFGPTVNRTARLMAAAHGGQTLLSAAMARQVADDLPEGVCLRDLGLHRLRDLAEPEHAFQLLDPDLPQTFPPLATLDITPNNLPTQASVFLGRERELGEIRALLDQPTKRMVTLVGPGGTGKTRLGLQSAADQIDRFGDGVFFVDLSTETDPEESFANIARTIGVDPAGDETALDTLRERLADRRIMLILDNLEQIDGIGTGITALLEGSAGLVVLATSRQPVRIRGEQIYVVDPLSLPTVGPGRMKAEDVMASEAAQLFAERAAAAIHGFVIESDNAGDVASICIRLDGLPLALELAAARLRLFSLPELRNRLDSQMDLLKGGAHDLPSRQQTLRSTIEWSFELLSNSEKGLLEILAVFAGATFDDVSSVSATIDEDGDVIDDLTSLVDKSLVRTGQSESGSSRYGLLETIRQFSIDRLNAQAERLALIKRCHADYFARVADQLHAQLRTAEREAAIKRLRDELENLQLAWTYWAEAQDVERLHCLFDPMWMLYDSEGWYHGSLTLAEDLLAALDHQADSAERTHEQIALQTSLARIRLLIKGYTEESERAFLDSLESAEAGGQIPDLFPVLRSLASFYTLSGQLQKAVETGEKLLRIADEEHDPRLYVDANLVYGANKAFMNELDEGLEHLSHAVERFDPTEMPSDRFRLGPHPGIVALTTSGFLLWLRGYPEQAGRKMELALTDAETLGHSYSRAYALYHVAYFNLWNQNIEGVGRHANELLALANQYDYQIWRALALILLAVVTALTEDPEKGLAEVERGIEAYQSLQAPPAFWGPLQQIRATLAGMAGRVDRGLELIGEAVALASEARSGMLTEMLITQGDLHLMIGRANEAIDAYHRSLEAAVTYDTRLAELRAATRLARLGGPDELQRLRRVYNTFTEGFDIADLIAARELLEP